MTKEQIIDDLLQRSKAGIQRETLESAFEAGAATARAQKAAAGRVTFELVVLAFVALMAIATVAVYIANFVGQPVASDGGAWGQFGDYIGGLLNPTVAFAALLLLYRSITLQKKELADTRDVLAQQSESARLQAELSGYTAAISACQDQVQILQGQRQFYIQQVTNHAGHGTPIFEVDGTGLSLVPALDALGKLEQAIAEEMRSKAFYERRLRKTLGEQGLGGHHSEDNQKVEAPLLVNESQFFPPEVKQTPAGKA
jgi:hypothetical protein